MPSEPRARRPHFPEEYGAGRGDNALLPWSHVEEKLRAAMHYWVATVGPGGAPHARPLDGLWVEGRLYFGGSPETRWRRNAQRNPAICLHLESAEDVVIVHGRVEEARPDAALAERLVAASREKYGFAPPAEAYRSGVHWLRMHKVYAWTDLRRDATRWDVEPEN